METKFKIGDEIVFMKDNAPLKRKVKGISIHKGEINELNFSKKDDEGVVILYHYETYGNVDERNVFRSIEDLKEDLFKDFKE